MFLVIFSVRIVVGTYIWYTHVNVSAFILRGSSACAFLSSSDSSQHVGFSDCFYLQVAGQSDGLYLLDDGMTLHTSRWCLKTHRTYGKDAGTLERIEEEGLQSFERTSARATPLLSFHHRLLSLLPSPLAPLLPLPQILLPLLLLFRLCKILLTLLPGLCPGSVQRIIGTRSQGHRCGSGICGSRRKGWFCSNRWL